MKSNAITPEEYIAELSKERKEVISKLREVILKNLPTGFEETISYGMLGYVVPHSLYPSGYHCDPTVPLPFINLASQKNFVAFYHMGIYTNTDLLTWFQTEYPQYTKQKLDMGKSCIRLKKLDDIPYPLIGKLCKKLTPKQWISCYEDSTKKSKKKK